MIKTVKLNSFFSHYLMKRIISVAFWSGVSKILLFAVSIILARVLDPQEYGKYILFMVVLNSVVNMFDLRLSQVVIPEMKQIQNKKLLSFINISLETSMAILGFLALCIFVFFGLNHYIKLDISNFELMLSFVFILGYHLQRAALTTTQAYEQYGMYNLITVMFPLLFVIAIVLFYKFLDSYSVAVEYRAYSLGVLGCLSFGLIYKNTFVNILKEIQGFKEEFKTIFNTISKHSQTSMLIGWLGLIYYNVDRLMIGWLGSSSAEVGYYANGILLGTLLTHFSNSIVQAIYPNFSKAYLNKNIDKVKQYLRMYNKFVFFIIMPIAILLACYSKEIVVFFFGDKYIESVIIFQIWILFIPFYIWPALLLKLVYIRKEHKRFLSYVGLAVIVNVILNYFLIPSYGILGAVISTIACFGINTFFAFKIANECLKTNDA